MKIEEQVISLELAKKLKELGVKQDMEAHSSYWVNLRGDWRFMTMDDGEDSPSQTTYEWAKAFTVAELLDIAPPGTSVLKRTEVETNSNPRYYVETPDHYRKSDWHENPAEALGLMLAFLYENNLIPNHA